MTIRVLHLAKDLTLPLDAATESFAILGRRGSGKDAHRRRHGRGAAEGRRPGRGRRPSRRVVGTAGLEGREERWLSDLRRRRQPSGHPAVGALAEWLGQPRPLVHAALSEMGRLGLVQRASKHEHRWGLASAGRAQPAKPVKPVTPAPALRHPTETPARIAVNPEESLSWWVGLSRSELEVQAIARMEKMRSSKENKHVPFRILQ